MQKGNWPGETYFFTQIIRSLEFESHWNTPCWFIHWMPWEVFLLNYFFVDKCLLKKEGDGSTRWWDQQTLSQRPGKAAKINSISLAFSSLSYTSLSSSPSSPLSITPASWSWSTWKRDVPRDFRRSWRLPWRNILIFRLANKSLKVTMRFAIMMSVMMRTVML